MGRCCKICGSVRANEQFGGRGLRRVICSRCRKLPVEERREILLVGEVLDFLEQSNISKKNIARLEKIEQSSSGRVACLAQLIREIALVRSYRRKRWHYVGKERPDLLERARFYGFIEEDHFDIDQLDEEDWDAELFDLTDDVRQINQLFDIAAIADSVDYWKQAERHG